MTGPSSPCVSLPTIHFDLDSYIARYEPKSETRLQRLLFIARKLSKYVDQSTAARDSVTAAYSQIEKHLKDNCDTQRYQLIFRPAADSMNHTELPRCVLESIVYDPSFVTQTEIASTAQLQKLEALLASAQAHLAKESIRSVNLSLIDFYQSRGDMATALRYALRTRDFCTNSRASSQVYLLIIQLLLHMGNYTQVLEFVAKANLLKDTHVAALHHSNSGDSLDGTILFSSQLDTASALAYLEQGHFLDAAKKLLNLNAGFNHQFHSVISAEDIAMYGGILALATMSRQELLTHMVDHNAIFKERLELVPWIRDAIQHYVRAEYRTCLSILYTKKLDFDLDIRFHRHADAILQSIRDKCLIQFFSPYSVVPLQSMADCIGVQSIQEVEQILANLILDGKWDGVRINCWTQTFHAVSPDEVDRQRQKSTYRKVTQWGDRFLAQSQNALLRLSCMEHGIMVREDPWTTTSTTTSSMTIAGGKKSHAWGKYGSYAPEEERISNYIEKEPRLPLRGPPVEYDPDPEEEEDVVMLDMD